MTLRTLLLIVLVAGSGAGAEASAAARAFLGVSPAPSAWLAQASGLPDPQSWGTMGWFVIALVAVIGLGGMVLAAINGALTLREKLRGEQTPAPHRVEQPIVTKLAESLVTHDALNERLARMASKDELVEMERRLSEQGDERRSALEESIADLDGKERERIGNVHKRLDKLQEQMGGVNGKLELIVATMPKGGRA